LSDIDWDSPEIADEYDRNCEHQFQKGSLLVSMMGFSEGHNVLDAGCGTGRQATNVAGIIGPSGRLTGIDPSSYRISLANKKIAGHSGCPVRFLVGQAENLSMIPDDSVDHAYFCSSFHWIDDKKTALGEVFRVLKTGGRVGMTTRNRDNQDLMTSLEKILKKYYVSMHVKKAGGTKRVTAPELGELLSAAGFTGISLETRVMPRNEGTQDEHSMHLSTEDRITEQLKDLPDEIREKIMQEIDGELEKQQNPGSPKRGNCTLFAIASKPGKGM